MSEDFGEVEGRLQKIVQQQGWILYPKAVGKVPSISDEVMSLLKQDDELNLLIRFLSRTWVIRDSFSDEERKSGLERLGAEWIEQFSKLRPHIFFYRGIYPIIDISQKGASVFKGQKAQTLKGFERDARDLQARSGDYRGQSFEGKVAFVGEVDSLVFRTLSFLSVIIPE